MRKINKVSSAEQTENAQVDKPFFLGSAVVILGMILLMVIFDKQTGALMNDLYNFTAYNFGWAYLAITLIFLFVILYIAFSKLGRIRLGGPKARPEFKTMTWIAMFFCSGCLLYPSDASGGGGSG